MASTVNRAFDEFINDVLTISDSDKDSANSSIDALKNQIDRLSEKGKIPKTTPSMHYCFGSFSRRTKNPPLNDINLIVCFDSCGCLQYQGNSWNDIKLIFNGTNQQLQNLCDKSYQYTFGGSTTNYELNSNRFKNKLVSELSGIQYYKKAELHARGEAVTLNLSSYDWSFDVVPAFFSQDDDQTIFLIPNGKGRWKKTNPKKERKRIADLNSRFRNMAGKVVRLVKYWNKRGKMPTMTSYVLETMVLDFFDTLAKPGDSETLYPDCLFRDALNYISSHINGSIADSKEIEGNINSLDYLERYKIMTRARNDWQKAKNAFDAEVSEKNQEKAINIWRDIFGEEFPSYE